MRIPAVEGERADGGARAWSGWSPNSAAPRASTTPRGPTTAPRRSRCSGGALKGGRVIAEWPGVKEASRYEGRDLKPTTDLRAVMKGILKDQLRADERALMKDVFPDSQTVKPLAGLIA
jgi:hypothetical protein